MLGVTLASCYFVQSEVGYGSWKEEASDVEIGPGLGSVPAPAPTRRNGRDFGAARKQRPTSHPRDQASHTTQPKPQDPTIPRLSRHQPRTRPLTTQTARLDSSNPPCLVEGPPPALPMASMALREAVPEAAQSILRSAVRRNGNTTTGVVISAGLAEKTVKVRVGGEVWNKKVQKVTRERRPAETNASLCAGRADLD